MPPQQQQTAEEAVSERVLLKPLQNPRESKLWQVAVELQKEVFSLQSDLDTLKARMKEIGEKTEKKIKEISTEDDFTAGEKAFAKRIHSLATGGESEALSRSQSGQKGK